MASSRHSQAPGLAPAGPDRAEPVQRAEPDVRGRAAPAQQLAADGHGLVPAARPLQDAGPLAAQEDGVGGDVMVVAVGDALGEVPLGAGPVPVGDIAGVQVRRRPGPPRPRAGRPARCPGPGAACPAHSPPVARTAHASVFSASLSTSVRPSGPAIAWARRASSIASRVGAAHHPHRRQAGVRPGQLGARAQRLEQRYRGLGRRRCPRSPRLS